MQTTQTISINKIIVFVVFVCAAIMTSLFVFHNSHSSAPTQLTNDAGIIFPVGRDIKSFSLITSENKKFTQQDFMHHWTLLFFGFTHCSTICPTTLELLNRVYQNLYSTYPNLQVVFISLDPTRDSPETLATYLRPFHTNFLGITGKLQELRKLQSQLGIIATMDKTGDSNNYQLIHTSSILLINPQGKWAGLFKNNMNADKFTQAVKEGIHSLPAYS